MMPDFSYTPRRKNNLPVIVITACVCLMIVCTVFLMLRVGSPLVFQLLFLACAVGIIYFFSRYIAVSYTYTISYEQNAFIVVQRKGRRLVTLCRLDLSALYRVRPYEADDETERKHTNRYQFCVSMRPPESTLLFFDDGEHIVSIRVEIDDVFFKTLSDIAEQNSYTPCQTAEQDEEY